MFKRIRSDIQCILDRDPAARSTWEVLTLYPGLHALVLHRLAHRFWVRDLRWLGRFISQFSRWLTGIEIHPGATIAERVFIDPEAPKKLMPRLNQLFNRAQLTPEEIHILRGVAKAMAEAAAKAKP